MKFLTICSYICAVAAIVFGVMGVYLSFKAGDTGGMILSIVLLILLPGVTQFYHTFKSVGMYYLTEYKETKSLDDFLLNDLDSNERVVGTSFWQKIFSVVNCVLLCAVFIFVSYLFRELLREIGRLSFDKTEDFIGILILVIYLFALPTIIFNLRTFNLKRIKP